MCRLTTPHGAGDTTDGATSGTAPNFVGHAGPSLRRRRLDIGATGSESACGTRTDGTVWCWGANSFDETGRSGNALEPSPVQVGTRTGWTAVSAGIAACALYGPTTLWCWGSNFSGQIGQGVTGHEYPNPRIVGTSANWIRVSAGAGDVNDGRSSVCGIQRGWSLWCWGDNQEGQLGLGTTGGSKNTPQQVG